jgi:hypothetical protein
LSDLLKIWKSVIATVGATLFSRTSDGESGDAVEAAEVQRAVRRAQRRAVEIARLDGAVGAE